MTHTYYALHRKGTGLFFGCHAKTLEAHEEKVRCAFNVLQSLQAKGTTLTMDDYMKGRTRVKIIVEELS